MKIKIKNPFSGWREDQQCRGAFAKNSTGASVTSHSPKACRWCAYGRLMAIDVPAQLIVAFNRFAASAEGADLFHLNDSKRWTPEMFKRLWTRFVRSSK